MCWAPCPSEPTWLFLHLICPIFPHISFQSLYHCGHSPVTAGVPFLCSVPYKRKQKTGYLNLFNSPYTIKFKRLGILEPHTMWKCWSRLQLINKIFKLSPYWRKRHKHYKPVNTFPPNASKTDFNQQPLSHFLQGARAACFQQTNAIQYSITNHPFQM